MTKMDIKGTVFSKIQSSASDGEVRKSRLDTASLIKHFCKKNEPLDTVRRATKNAEEVKAMEEARNSPEGKKRAAQVVKILDTKRANNVSITVKPLRKTPAEIRSAVEHVDVVAHVPHGETSPCLSLDDLRALQVVCPTDEERKLFSSFRGDPALLTEADRLFVELLEIPRLADKLRSMVFMVEFEPRMRSSEEQVRGLLLACQEVQNSQILVEIIHSVLAIGNFLNAPRDSPGFKLEGLLKLKDTRAFGNQNVTLLHYLAFMAESEKPELFAYEAELPHLKHGATVSLEVVASEIGHIEEDLRVLEQEVMRCSCEVNEGVDDDGGAEGDEGGPARKAMTPSQEIAQAFRERLFPFSAEAFDRVTRLKASLDEMRSLFASAAAYFGEDPAATKSDEFFALLLQFFLLFKHTRVEIGRKDIKAHLLARDEEKEKEKEKEVVEVVNE
jgi:diaphanous 1